MPEQGWLIIEPKPQTTQLTTYEYYQAVGRLKCLYGIHCYVGGLMDFNNRNHTTQCIYCHKKYTETF